MLHSILNLDVVGYVIKGQNVACRAQGINYVPYLANLNTYSRWKTDNTNYTMVPAATPLFVCVNYQLKNMCVARF